MQKLCVRQLLGLITTLTLYSYAAAPQAALAAETHVVNLAELQQDLYLSQQARATDLADMERVLALPAVQEGLSKAHLDTSRVMTAMAELDDKELARLADRARAVEEDVEGGFIVGVLALIGLIVVVLIVLTVIKNNE